MPSAEDPTPYVNPNNIGPRDYFGHRLVSSPLAKERLSIQSGSVDAHRRTSIPRKPVGSPTHEQIDARHTQSIPSKAIVSPPRRNVDESSNTIVHTTSAANSFRNEPRMEEVSNKNFHRGNSTEKAMGKDYQLGGASQDMAGLRNDVPKVNAIVDSFPPTKAFLESVPLSQKSDAFLDTNLVPLGPESLLGKEATVTLSPSASTNQAGTLPRLDKSPMGTSSTKLYKSLRELPPVTLKDPFAARITLNCRPMISMTWAPPTILSSPKRVTPKVITIPTTTITGFAPLLPLHAQYDDQEDEMSQSHVRRISIQRKSSRILARTSCHPSSKWPPSRSTGCQTDRADIAMSSERLLATTKPRTTDSCHTLLPDDQNVVVENTPISMSTSHTINGTGLPAARNAYLNPFQNMRRPAAMQKAPARDREEPLTPPRLWAPIMVAANISPGRKVAHGGHVGTEDPFKIKADYDAYRSEMNAEGTSSFKTVGWKDSIVIWHPSPNAEKGESSLNSGPSGPSGRPSFSLSPRNASPSPRRKLTSDEKYGIVRHGDGSSSVMTGGSPKIVYISPRAGRNLSHNRGQVSPGPYKHYCTSCNETLLMTPFAERRASCKSLSIRS